MIFQIDPALNAKLGHDLNADLANIQKAAQAPDNDMLGRAFRSAYGAILVSYDGDEEDGTTLAGSTLAVDAATTVQRDLHDAMAAANLLDENTDATLTANKGPDGATDWWNWSSQQWGLVQGFSPDASLKTATVARVTGTSVEWVTGLASPAPAAQ